MTNPLFEMACFAEAEVTRAEDKVQDTTEDDD